MNRWEIGWGVFLAGLPFAHFVLSPDRINPWQAQTLWAQLGLAGLWGASLAYPVRPLVRNRPLGWWTAWICLSVWWTWLEYLKRDQSHPIGLLPPLMHGLCVTIFYLAATSTWTIPLLERLIKWIALAGLVLVGYGFLQAINFDQFYRFVDGSRTGDTIMGTIGNPTHFGLYLALILPTMLWQVGRAWRVAAIVTSLLILLTHSTSAVACSLAVWFWWAWHTHRAWAWGGLAVGVAGVVWMCWSPSWSNLEGRKEAWEGFYRQYLSGQGHQQITGTGLGRILMDVLAGKAVVVRDAIWRHAHCEYLHFLIEQGVVGLSLILWGCGEALWKGLQAPRTRLANTLLAMWGVFLLSSLVNFPAHLWMLASLGLVAYCGLYVLSRESQPT